MTAITFTNFKGGTTKTTTCRELGFYFTTRGYKVLFVDCDSQGNLTRSVLDERPGRGLYEALSGSEFEIKSINGNLSILTGDFRLSGLDKRLIGEIDAYTRLKNLFADERFKSYDLVLLDTAPALNMLTTNALAATGHIVITMLARLYSLQGCNDIIQAIAKIRTSFNPSISLLGVVINSFDKIPIINRQIKREIQQAFGNKVFNTIICKSIKFEEAIAVRTGVIHLTKLDKSRAKQEICLLGQELLNRLGLDGRGSR